MKKLMKKIGDRSKRLNLPSAAVITQSLTLALWIKEYTGSESDTYYKKNN